MEKDDIKLQDLRRILLGEAPAEFLLEVLVRSFLTYIILLIVLKLLGKRMSGRLSNTEMAVMLMFGAVVSSAMQIPERGIVESCFILCLVLIFQRVFTLWTINSRALEKATLGTVSLIVKNGMIQPGFMNKELLSHGQLFRKLRAKSIMQLGEIKRVYMETNGSFTIIKAQKPVAGLSVLPREDNELHSLLEEDRSTVACSNCGKIYKKEEKPLTCEICNSAKWSPAVIKKQNQ